MVSTNFKTHTYIKIKEASFNSNSAAKTVFSHLLLTRGDLAYCLFAHNCLAIGRGEFGLKKHNVNLGAGGLASHMFLFIPVSCRPY